MQILQIARNHDENSSQDRDFAVCESFILSKVYEKAFSERFEDFIFLLNIIFEFFIALFGSPHL